MQIPNPENIVQLNVRAPCWLEELFCPVPTHLLIADVTCAQLYWCSHHKREENKSVQGDSVGSYSSSFLNLFLSTSVADNVLQTKRAQALLMFESDF